MTKLGGRKFIGFIVLTILGLWLALKGKAVDVNVVALLVGVYGIFAGTNTWAGSRSPEQPASPNYGDENVAAFLNRALMPQLSTLVQAQQQTQEGLGQVAEQLTKQPPVSSKLTAEQYRAMLEQQGLK